MPSIKGHHIIILAAAILVAYLVYKHYKQG